MAAITRRVLAIRAGLTQIDGMSEQIRKHIPFANVLGIEVVSATKERIEAHMLVRPDLCNPVAGLHGGAAMSLADTLGAMGASMNLPEGAKGTTTLESKTNFIGVAKAAYDPTGHYSRPDVVRLLLNKKPGSRVHAFDPEYTEVGKPGEEAQR